MVTLNFQLTREEYLDYSFYTAWASPDKKWYRMKYYLQVSTVYFTIAGLYIYANRLDSLLLHLAVFLTIGVLYFMLVPVLVRRSIKARVTSILKEPENHHVENSEVILTESGIVDRDTASESFYNWDQILRRAETKMCFYLYTNAHHAVVIPKRVLPAEQQRDVIRMFDSHLPLSSEFAA